MKTPIDRTKWIFAFSFITACLCLVLAAGITLVLAKSAAAKLDACEISVLDIYFWRDFMPIVSRPGPDGGSPLRAKVKLSLDNSRGADNEFSFKTVVVDEEGRVYPVSFRVMPRNRVPSYRTPDEGAKRTIAASHDVMRNVEVKRSEISEIELITAEGPYLPVGSSIHVEITWTDQKGDSVIVRTPVAQINRTD